MDFEAILITKVLDKGDLSEVFDHRISDELFESYPEIWEFVKGIYAEHGGLPPKQYIEERFPSFVFQDSEAVPVSFLIDQLKKRHTHNLLASSLRRQAEFLKQKDPYGAVDDVRSTLMRLDIETRPSLDMNFSEDIDERVKRYEEAELAGGLTGIPTPWPVLDEATQGFQPEELIMIAGRGKTGKTFLMMHFARVNWENGYVPLVFSREMAVWQLARRLDAMHAGLPYQKFKAGMLTTEQRQRWDKSLENLRGSRPLWITGDDGDGNLGVAAITAKIHRYQPHIVYIDGAYLVHDDRKGRQKWEKFYNVCQDLKRMAQREKIPVVVTHQFGSSGKGMDGTEDTLKFGDVQMWFDIILGCYRGKEIGQKEMLMKILKHREGVEAQWVTEWDLDTMNFDQKPSEEELRDGQTPYDEEGPIKF